MKYFVPFLFCLFLYLPAQSQVKFLSRYEVESDYFDPLFEMVPSAFGLVSFRTLPQKGQFNKRTFQYFVSNEDLESEGLIELPVKDGYDMVGYDTDKEYLFVLFQRGRTVGANKYVLQINLNDKKGFEYTLGNLLEMELNEFLVQGRSVIVMGMPDTRPVIQVYDLDDKSTHTLQGIYGNDTQILQVRKREEIESFEVVLSRKGKYREREISINTYDLSGNLLREVKVEQFGEQGQEIMNAFLFSSEGYRQMMVGAYGLDRRDSYQGMYVLDINEFGEYEDRIYTLEDFPNFYNYLDERAKARKDREIDRNVNKGKVPTIRNNYAIRAIVDSPEGLLVYFDHYDIITTRTNFRGINSPMNLYRSDRWTRPGMASANDLFFLNSATNPVSGFQVDTEFSYLSAHFVQFGKEGQVLWDNAASFDNMQTRYQVPFGEMAKVDDELYHAYVREDKIMLAYFKDGEKVFDNLEFDIKLTNENERISQTNRETLQLVHWYDRYFLLSGTQKIRYQKENGSGASRDVYFVTKVLFAGDLYEPEEKLK
ncbi:hypothetical protein SAMN04488104_102350 [Algoriphagus faecimaris]|uniref:Uncharacterized protein n=1 Tax=Algoriphagus faecimaris TaxID=686796 RepID=A0A1G6TR69_9BACT|nr:hypothetical protein [Algoriphagus faecimaris]SDD30976.1 hypothetical protein SAMN04488104_102350 [Algoriphagus faecimaris]